MDRRRQTNAAPGRSPRSAYYLRSGLSRTSRGETTPEADPDHLPIAPAGNLPHVVPELQLVELISEVKPHVFEADQTRPEQTNGTAAVRHREAEAEGAETSRKSVGKDNKTVVIEPSAASASMNLALPTSTRSLFGGRGMSHVARSA